MDLPSMVERNGGQLVVRSLVSGAAVYQTPMEASEAANVIRRPNLLMGVEQMERQLEHYSLTNRLMETLPLQPARENVPEGPSTASEPSGVNGDVLPQCKIRRNYSCNQCAFFTQNPRSHLSHLRDVHGERIVINECKLCLYASRHFQKLVRHMKMVHGCSDDGGAVNAGGIAGVPMKGKRNISRELRKRRLEESIEVPAPSINTSINPGLLRMLQNGPSLEQLKCELQQQEQQLRVNVEAYNRQQELYQLQEIVANNNNIFSMAFEFQSRMMPIPLPPPPPPPPPTQAAFKMEPENSSSEDSEEANSGSPTPEGNTSNVLQYQCHKCSYNTPIRARFKKHVKYHSMPLIKCNSCDFHTPYKWNLDRHTKNHGANGVFKCTVCDFSSDIKQSLTIHEQNHHVPTVGQQKAARRRNLEENEEFSTNSKKLDFESEPGEQTNGITCSHCQQKVLNAMDLIKHLQVCASALRSTNQQESEQVDEELPQAVNDLSYCGVETAPGYGEIIDQLSPEEVGDYTPWKKVFKCPHCTFWAATASRFHVHIVGHLNRKPFECSLCSYRSNWRWDITKHIRLKAMRDKSHNDAQVLMNDETGRRNYAKYNQYLTLMKVNADQVAANQESVKGLNRTTDKLEQLYEPIEHDDNSEIMEPPLDLSKPKDPIKENTKAEEPAYTGFDASLCLHKSPKRMKYDESNEGEIPLDLSKPISSK